jgi:hypothetical protein
MADGEGGAYLRTAAADGERVVDGERRQGQPGGVGGSSVRTALSRFV